MTSSSLRESATFVEQHRSATDAVSEAARRAQLWLGNSATGGKAPSEATAAAQRQWLSALDHHEAWMRRRWVIWGGGGGLAMCEVLYHTRGGDDGILGPMGFGTCVCVFAVSQHTMTNRF